MFFVRWLRLTHFFVLEVILVKIEKKTGFPSVDKPWLQYYSETAINAELPKSTMYEIVYNNNQSNLEKTALEYYGTKISYECMLKEISIIAGNLEKYGVKEGDVVTICMINSPETICLLFALNKIGAVANMVYGSSTVQELEKYILDVKSSFVFTLDIFQNKFIEIAKNVQIKKIVVTSLSRSMKKEECEKISNINFGQMPLPCDSCFVTWEQFFSFDEESKYTCHNPEADAIITYTGGTTGGSKGVILQNKAVLAVVYQYILGEKELSSNSIWALTLPLFIAYGTAFALMIPLVLGMTVIVRIPLMESIADIYKKFKPNHIMHGPAFWEKFADDNEDLDLSNLIAPFAGGDILRLSVEKKINEYFKKNKCKYPLMNAYGITEAGTGVATNYSYFSKIGSVGIPFVKTIISAFDTETGEELAYGKEGEICIQTPSVMKGYVNSQAETENILRKHIDGKIWVHSGDLGYVNEDGFVYISGRLKRYISCVKDGVFKKVFSLDIEKELLKNPQIAKCAVVPVPNETFNESPYAYIITKKECKDYRKLKNEIEEFCYNNLQDVYRPIKYSFVTEFPLTKIGKVDYKILEEWAKADV